MFVLSKPDLYKLGAKCGFFKAAAFCTRIRSSFRHFVSLKSAGVSIIPRRALPGGEPSSVRLYRFYQSVKRFTGVVRRVESNPHEVTLSEV